MEGARIGQWPTRGLFGGTLHRGGGLKLRQQAIGGLGPMSIPQFRHAAYTQSRHAASTHGLGVYRLTI
eukprot:2411648-Pleurochrysis_carterae.AAC.2